MIKCIFAGPAGHLVLFLPRIAEKGQQRPSGQDRAKHGYRFLGFRGDRE